MIKKIIPLACALLISACGQSDTPANTSAQKAAPAASTAPVSQQPSKLDPAVLFDDLYREAESLVAKAVEKRAVWSATESMLEEALVASTEGRSEAALKLAFEAKMQAELAIAQADREKETWRSQVLSNE